MSLATYLKADIDSFLDEIIGQGTQKNNVREEEFDVFTIEKDYAGLTEQAFDKNDTNSIEKMLKELRKQVNNELLESGLREKVKSVLDEVEDIVLKRIDEVDSHSLHVDAKNILTKRKKENASHEETYALFAKGISVIEKFIVNKKIDQAKLAYQRLVKDFKAHASGPDRDIWKKRIFAVFEKIKKAQSRIEKEKDQLSEKQKIKLDSIKEKISQVIHSLGSVEPSILENKLLEIKQDIIAAKLSKKQGEPFLPILRTLVSKINFLKQTKEKEFLLEQKKAAEEKEAKNKELETKKEAQKKKLEAEKIIARAEALEEEKMMHARRIVLSQEEINTYEKALSLQNKGEYTEAKKLYAELLVKNPKNIRAEIRLKEIANKKK